MIQDAVVSGVVAAVTFRGLQSIADWWEGGNLWRWQLKMRMKRARAKARGYDPSKPLEIDVDASNAALSKLTPKPTTFTEITAAGEDDGSDGKTIEFGSIFESRK